MAGGDSKKTKDDSMREYANIYNIPTNAKDIQKAYNRGLKEQAANNAQQKKDKAQGKGNKKK
jgi:hypothetical protein